MIRAVTKTKRPNIFTDDIELPRVIKILSLIILGIERIDGNGVRINDQKY